MKNTDKNLNELPTGITEEELEIKLEETESIGKLVQLQEDDEPSMIWRASLNQKLIEMSVQSAPKKVAFFRTWRFGMVAGLAAGCLAIAIVLPRKNTIVPSGVSVPANESVILAAHSHADFTLGLGTTDGAQAINSPTSEVNTVEWTEADLTIL